MRENKETEGSDNRFLPTENGNTHGAADRLGRRVYELRKKMGASQRQLADIAGISYSVISKIENSQLSPTYDTLLRLAQGLKCDIVHLFKAPTQKNPIGRRSITRKGESLLHSTANYDYELLCNDIIYKKMTPLRVTIKSKSLQTFGKYLQHEGEEVIFVLSGLVEVRTEFYEPVTLQSGDCIYFDSTMEHACLNNGDEDAVVFWVCSSHTVKDVIQKS